MINTGTTETHRWALRPGAYQSWIVAYGPVPVKYAIVEIPSTGTSQAPRMIVSAGAYKACGHPKVPSHARASFGNCDDHPGGPNDLPDPSSSARTGLSRLLAMVMPKALFAQGPGSLDGPAWIDCGGDCCVTD